MSATIVDLSNVNSITTNAFRLMAAAGIDGVWMKVSEGKTFDDRMFGLREALAESGAGLRVGGYHFARPDLNTPKEEANHFLSRYKSHDDPRALKAVLDMEASQAARLHRTLIEWSREWMRLVKAELGYWPLFYSYPDYVSRVMGMTTTDKPIGGGLWLASYGRNDGREHPYTVPAPWKKAVAHQFTSNGRVPGVAGSCDVSLASSITPLLAHRPPRKRT